MCKIPLKKTLLLVFSCEVWKSFNFIWNISGPLRLGIERVDETINAKTLTMKSAAVNK